MPTKKLKYSALLTAIAMPCLFLTACDSRKQKELNAKWEAQASKNAQAYINQKYGFNARITKAEVDRIHGMFGTNPISDVFVDMKYESRDFTVYITGAEESTDGCDTYQGPEIKQALFDTINSEKDGLQLLDITPQRKSENRHEEPLYAAYFDGSNLSEMLEDGVNSFQAYYVQADLSDTDDFAWLDNYRTTAKFISCRDSILLGADEQTRSWAAPHPVYCDNIRTVYCRPEETKKEITYSSYVLQNYGDFYYYASTEYDYEKSEPSEEMPHITEVSTLDISKFDGNGTLNSSAISKAYSISAEAPMYINIYYPHSKLNTDKDLKTYFTNLDYGNITKNDDGTDKYAALPATNVGDYVYQRIYIEKDKPTTFVVLYS